ncbi:MAG: hypothetical protein ACOC2W_03390, partial [bacterium]
MKRSNLLSSLFISGIILVIANTFIRVSSPNGNSSGIVIDFILSNGLIKSIIYFVGLILIIYVVSQIYYFIKGRKKINFWRLVSKNPNKAYHLFLDSPAWEVFNYPLEKDIDEDKWAGPFDLYVPEIKSRIVILGCLDKYEETQKELMNILTEEKKNEIKNSFENQSSEQESLSLEEKADELIYSVRVLMGIIEGKFRRQFPNIFAKVDSNRFIYFTSIVTFWVTCVRLHFEVNRE